MKFQGGKILILLILLSGFFCCQKYINADEVNVVFNEIAWMGTEVSNNDEWIELRNLTDTEIILDGWRLVAQDGTPEINLIGTSIPNGYYLLERTDDDSVSEVVADLIYAGALENSGEVLELYDSDNNLIDVLDMNAGWLAGDNETKQTMERTTEGNWQTSNAVGGTPGKFNTLIQTLSLEEEDECENGELEDSEECDDGNTIDGDGCDNECKIENDVEDDDEMGEDDESDEEVVEYKLGDLLINEFVSDPADGEVEWIELYNKTGKEVDLDGWNIEEGSESKTILEGVINKYFIIEKPNGNLNNSGDIIILRDNNNNLIDQVVYGEWDDGNIKNNAPVASDPMSVARILDGNNTFNNVNDFEITQKLTKGDSNIIEGVEVAEEELSQEEMDNYDYSSDIVISEIFPNPYGLDNDKEFVELYNTGDKDVDLNRWRIGDETSKKYELRSENLESVTIKARDYFIINRLDSKIALNNDSDTVKLYQPLKDKAFMEVEYIDAIEGWSYVFSDDGWVWTEVVTEGKENIIKTINHPPVVDFYCPEEAFVNTSIFFDSSDTVDSEDDQLKFHWDFDDGFASVFSSPVHFFTKEGSYVVRVVVSDGENEMKKEKIIKIIPHPNPLLNRRGSDNDKFSLPSVALAEEGEVIINEILPNPEGADAEGEFIELKNNSTQKINLLNWQLDDMEGGSKPYVINSDTWIDFEEYLMIHRSESGIALNNSFDSVRLFNSLEKQVDSVDYEHVIEGESYVRGENGKWFWTEIVTPGMENIVSVSEKRIESVGLQGEGKNILGEKIVNTYIETSLDNVKDLESGDKVKVKGVVAVLPGVLGTQYFYIVGSSSPSHEATAKQAGIQVYNYKKDFPNLGIGDYVEVSGEVSVVNGEKRIKTKSQEDIVKIDKQDEPKPIYYTCERVCEDNVGELITVSGEVVEQKSSQIYVDDGTDEVLVYIKTSTGINPKDYKEGEQVEITGIVSMAKSGLRVMPRNRNDIVRKDGESQEVGRVLGEVAVSDEWEIAKRDKKIELFKYLLVMAGGVIVLLGGLLFKEIRK